METAFPPLVHEIMCEIKINPFHEFPKIQDVTNSRDY